MGRHATVLITEPWPYRRIQQVAHRGSNLDRHVSKGGLAPPLGAARPILTPCAGTQSHPLVIPFPEHFSQLSDIYWAMRVETGADVLVMSGRPDGVW